MKVAHKLVTEGYLKSVRGRNGGLCLARTTDTVNLGELVRTMEANIMPVECFDLQTNKCILAPACQFRGILREALAAYLSVLDQYTLEDLMKHPEDLEKILRH